MIADEYDSIDIFLAVEDYFEISMPDDIESRVENLGQLADYVAEVFQAREGVGEVCLSARAFYRTRRVLACLCEVDRRKIRRDTPLESIIGGRNLRETWVKLRGELHGLGELELPRWGNRVVTASLVMWLVFWMGLSFLKIVMRSGWAFFMALGAAPVAVGVHKMLGLHFGKIPRRYATAGMLSSAMIPRAAKELHGNGQFHQREIWKIVQSLVAEVTEVEAEKLTRETKICDIGTETR
jgi:hypothetical protein